MIKKILNDNVVMALTGGALLGLGIDMHMGVVGWLGVAMLVVAFLRALNNKGAFD